MEARRSIDTARDRMLEAPDFISQKAAEFLTSRKALAAGRRSVLIVSTPALPAATNVLMERAQQRIFESSISRRYAKVQRPRRSMKDSLD